MPSQASTLHPVAVLVEKYFAAEATKYLPVSSRISFLPHTSLVGQGAESGMGTG